MNRSKIDFGVGIFVAIGIAALLFLSLKVGSLGGEELQAPYLVQARFDNIGGLKVRAPVKASGVVVGRVAGIHYDTERFIAVVSLNLDSRYPFPRDSVAAINTSGLLGEQYVDLSPGSEEANLKAGDVLVKTQSAMVLEKLIGRLVYDRSSNAEAGQ